MFTSPPPTNPRSSNPSNTDRLSKQIKGTPDKLRNVPKAHSPFNSLSNENSSKTQSRFPLTGSYGAIISINGDNEEKAKHHRVQPNGSGFHEKSTKNIILRPNEPEKRIRNDTSSMNNLFQQEQQHLANCVRLIAADMKEFEKEPSSNVDRLPTPPNSAPILRINPHSSIIPNQEVFRGTCADETSRLNLSPVKFPSQPLDLSTLSSSARMFSSELSKPNSSPNKKLQNAQGKVKRKRIRKQTEPMSMSIMPMTPMPHTSKDDDTDEPKEPSTDSGTFSSGGSERSLTVPKKRKRNSKTKQTDSSSQQTFSPISAGNHHNILSSLPSLVPIPPQNLSKEFINWCLSIECLSMPTPSDMSMSNAHKKLTLSHLVSKKKP